MLLVCLCMSLVRLAVWSRLLCSFGSIGGRCFTHDRGSTTGLQHLQDELLTSSMVACSLDAESSWTHSCGHVTHLHVRPMFSKGPQLWPANTTINELSPKVVLTCLHMLWG